MSSTKIGFVYKTIIRLDYTKIRYSHLGKFSRAFQQVFLCYYSYDKRKKSLDSLGSNLNFF